MKILGAGQENGMKIPFFAVNQNGQKKLNQGSIKASELNIKPDIMMEKKMNARKKAMEIVKTQFDADRKIEEDFETRRKHVMKLSEESEELFDKIAECNKKQGDLMKEYEIEEDSEEQQEINLLLKERQAKRGQAELTAEDIENLDKIGELTEYQSRYMDAQDNKELFEKRFMANKVDMIEEALTIGAVKKALDKNPFMMEDAKSSAEKIMEQASKEIIGMIYKEAVDQVKEDFEAEVEEAKEEKEKKEELEELQEKQKEKGEVQKELSDKMIEASDIEGDVQQEIQKLLEEMKLLEEDIKGIKVNQNI